MKKIVYFIYLIIAIPYNCISQPYYKLEIQLLDENDQLTTDSILYVYRDDLALYGFEVVSNKGYYYCPLDMSLCDSSFISFASYTNCRNTDRLYLQDICIASDGYKLGDYTVMLLCYNTISKRKYLKMMKRQFNRFYLTGWYPRHQISEATEVQ